MTTWNKSMGAWCGKAETAWVLGETEKETKLGNSNRLSTVKTTTM